MHSMTVSADMEMIARYFTEGDYRGFDRAVEVIKAPNVAGLNRVALARAKALFPNATEWAVRRVDQRDL